MNFDVTRRLAMAAMATGFILGGLTACSDPETEKGQKTPTPTGELAELERDAELAAMVPSDVRKRGSMTAAILPALVPLGFIDDNGEVVGLSIDLLQSAATLMDLELEVEKSSVDALIPGLEGKRFDMIGFLGDFEERREKTDFIDWLRGSGAILTAESFPKDEVDPGKDLCGLKLSYVRGSAQQSLVAEASENCKKNGEDPVDATPYGDPNAGLLSVKSGQAEAYWGDSAPMEYYVSENPGEFKIVAKSTEAYYGIGIHRDNAELTKALQAALRKLEEDGVYADLLERWGQQDYAVPELPINAGGSIAAVS